MGRRNDDLFLRAIALGANSLDKNARGLARKKIRLKRKRKSKKKLKEKYGGSV